METKICLLLLFIMASLPIKLNAFDLTGNNAQLKGFEELLNKVKAANNNPRIMAENYRLEREQIIRNDNSCFHCPKHLLLTEQINKVVEKLAKVDPKVGGNNQVPLKINTLKFLYYTQAMIDSEGNRDCKRFMDMTPDLKPTKFDGQFDLIAEDALSFSAVSSIQYMNPKAEEMVYYYRGEGVDKDIVVQAILTKAGGKFRYFRYTPSASELNPYNLPELGGQTEPPLLGARYLPDLIADSLKSKTEVVDAQTNKESGSDNYRIKFKTDVDTKNHFIPKNVHFVEAGVDQELFGGMKMKASSDTSLKGNAAKLALKTEDGSDLVLIDLDTKFDGKTEGKISVPYSVRVMESSDVKVKGKVQIENNTQVLTMSITDQSLEMVRTEYRRNNRTNTDSFVIAKDYQISPKEVISMQIGKGEDDKKYASIKHVKVLKENITLALDIRINGDRKATLMYQISAKF